MTGAGTHLGGYGWRPQAPDQRDRVFQRRLAQLPAETDLRPHMPPVYDQGQLGSCTANAIGAAMEYERTRQAEPDFLPSRLFIYYNERAMEGTIGSDSGAQIRDGIKVVNTQGACPESTWPYDISMFTVHPPRRCYVAALGDLALRYEAIQTLADLKDALASALAVVFGFTVYESFESQAVAASGVVPLPQPSERVVGGHAVLAVGYSDPDNRLTVRNSWGSSWGAQGYFFLPYEYLTGPGKVTDAAPVNGAYLASDFWTIQQTS
jgi:C1A family cysteine protease